MNVHLRLAALCVTLVMVVLASACTNTASDTIATPEETTARQTAEVIDLLIAHHHYGQVLTQQVLAVSVRPELRQQATDMLGTYDAETIVLQRWRDEWYPDIPPTTGLPPANQVVLIEQSQERPGEELVLSRLVAHLDALLHDAQRAHTIVQQPELRQFLEANRNNHANNRTLLREWQDEWYS